MPNWVAASKAAERNGIDAEKIAELDALVRELSELRNRLSHSQVHIEANDADPEIWIARQVSYSDRLTIKVSHLDQQSERLIDLVAQIFRDFFS